MNKTNLFAIVLAALAASCESSLGADATIGFTTLNRYGAIPVTYSWSITDPGSPFGASSAAELTVPFVLTASGALQSIEIPIARKSYTAKSTTSRTFTLAADDDGRPGTVLDSWTWVPGLNMTMVKLGSGKRPALTKGSTYWLTAHINPAGTAIDTWASNELGINDLLLYRKSVTQPYTAFESVLPAFRVWVGGSATPPPNQPPVARITATPNSGPAPLEVDFSGSGSSDSDGKIAKYEWQLDDGSTATGATPSHTFTDPGTYTVTLRVTDDDGATAETTATISVSEPEPPPPGGPGKVGYTTLNEAGAVPMTYAWTIADPGSPLGPSNAGEIAVPFVMQIGGPLSSVQLPMARKSYAASSTTLRTVSLSADDDGRPGRVIESWTFLPELTMSMVTLSSADCPMLAPGTIYWLTAHINPRGTAAEGWPSNELGMNGLLLYRKSVSQPLSGFTSVLPAFQINLESDQVPVNRPPVARISASTVTGPAPLDVSFSGAASSDPDGTVRSYEWTLGDGSTSTGPAAMHTFAAAGKYKVTLKVTDNGGATGQASVTVTVTAPPPPSGSITVGFTTLNAYGAIPATYSWSITDPGSPFGSSSAAELAASFVMKAGGPLHSVNIPIARKSYTADSTTKRTISLALDEGGRPGRILESWSWVPSATMTMVTLASSKYPEMTEGDTYWITAHINPSGTAIETWPSNELGIDGDLLYRRAVTQAYSAFTSVMPAFRVNVSPRGSGLMVGDPGSISSEGPNDVVASEDMMSPDAAPDGNISLPSSGDDGTAY